MSEKDHFDLVVLGGGSGGLAMAQRAAEYGARVAVVEVGRLGGTCVNVGCVPKKIMWEAGAAAHAIHDAAGYGFDVAHATHDWAALKTKRDAYVARLNGIYEQNLGNKHIEYIAGFGVLDGVNRVRVGERLLSAQRILLAVGGEPIVPDLPGAELGITSDGFFELDELPKRVALIGSGYIAVELAGMLQALGAEVNQFVRFDSVLREFDEILQQSAIEALQTDGVALRRRVVPAGLEKNDRGLILVSEAGDRFGPFDSVIWAVGRRPLTQNLGIESAGVTLDKGGFVSTDEFQQTSVADIFAVGDVTGRAALTPVAIAAGRRLADRLYGGMAGRRLDYDNIPTVVFTHPPMGTCGLSEKQARARYGDEVSVYVSVFVPMVNSFTVHRTEARMKLVTVGEEQRIVGVHLFGPGADEMLQGFAVAIRMGATKKDFDDTVAIHPTSAEELVTMR